MIRQCPLILIASLVLVSCGTPPSVQNEPVTPVQSISLAGALDNPCATDPIDSNTPETLKMLLLQSVDINNAPFATNDAERFVFKQIFQTLTRVDCQGDLQPGLASKWQSSYAGKRWVFTIRENAVFSDGSPITAQSVVRSWLRAARMDLRQPHPSPFQWLDVMEPGIVILDDHHLQISVSEAMDDLPLLLGHPALAVVLPANPDHKNLGSGPCILEPQTFNASDGFRLIPNMHHPRPPAWSQVDLIVNSGTDAHTMLNEDVDFAVFRNRKQIEYFEISRKHEVMPLPWDRMYLLVCPQGPRELRQRWTTDWSSRELVSDVSVGIATRLDQITFIAPRSRLCPLAMLPEKSLDWPLFSWPEMTAAHNEDLVLFPDNDPEAAALASFLAWHAGRPLRPADDLAGRTPMTTPRRPVGGMAPQALGISTDDFAGAFQSGRAGAYVLPMNRTWFSACRQIAALTNMASWLQDASQDQNTTDRSIPEGARAANPRSDFDVPAARLVENRLRRGRTVLPLTLVRPCLVADKSLHGFKTDFDGILDISDVSR
jgi:hypothetical protein